MAGPRSAVAVVDRGRPVAEAGERPSVALGVGDQGAHGADRAATSLDEGVLDLDEPRRPTGLDLRHLLAHASGLAFDSRPGRWPQPGVGDGSTPTAAYELAVQHVESRARPAVRRSAGGAPAVSARHGRDPAAGLTGARGRGAGAPTWPGWRRAARPTAPDHRRGGDGLVARRTRGSRVCCRGSDGRSPTTGASESRCAASSPRTGRRRHASPTSFGHFGQSGSFLWVDPTAGVACVAGGRHALRAVGGRGLAPAVRPGAAADLTGDLARRTWSRDDGPPRRIGMLGPQDAAGRGGSAGRRPLRRPGDRRRGHRGRRRPRRHHSRAVHGASSRPATSPAEPPRALASSSTADCATWSSWTSRWCARRCASAS